MNQFHFSRSVHLLRSLQCLHLLHIPHSLLPHPIVWCLLRSHVPTHSHSVQNSLYNSQEVSRRFWGRLVSITFITTQKPASQSWCLSDCVEEWLKTHLWIDLSLLIGLIILQAFPLQYSTERSWLNSFPKWQDKSLNYLCLPCILEKEITSTS